MSLLAWGHHGQRDLRCLGHGVSLSGDQAEINPAKTNARAQGQLVGRPGEKDQPELETPQGRPSAR